MPLETRIKRNGKQMANKHFPYGWDYAVLNCFLTAACCEMIPDAEATASGLTWKEVEEQGKFVDLAEFGIYYMGEPYASSPLWKGQEVVLQRDHIFHPYADENQPITLLKGDVLYMYRSSR